MILLRQLIFSLAATMVCLAASGQPAFPPQPDSSTTAAANGQPVPSPVSAISPMSAPVVRAQSPVAFFRRLLAMTPSERNMALTNRAPVARARILTKVQEYLMLPRDERELRLRSTDLRWYLTPLLQMSPVERQARLAQMPEDMRDLAESRLTQWDILPPSLQQEFLANDNALPYFAHVEATSSATAGSGQDAIAAQFNQFFELTPGEKKQALNALSDSERVEMEKTLKSFNQLPREQRQLCVRNYARFAGMTPGERADFLKNANRWAKMSPRERQTWQDLVAHVPIWPPMPTTEISPDIITPPSPTRIGQPHVATN